VGAANRFYASLVGCPPSIEIHVAEVAQLWPHATKIRACLASQCQDFAPIPKRALGIIFLQGPRIRSTLKNTHDAKLTLEILGSNGRTLFHATRTVAAKKTMPNGPQCEPTCYLVAACPSPAWVR
jgi:hypothetical protein